MPSTPTPHKYYNLPNNFISMSHPTHPTHPNPKPKKTKHDDWVCTLCKNYNYSFRAQCTSPLT